MRQCYHSSFGHHSFNIRPNAMILGAPESSVHALTRHRQSAPAIRPTAVAAAGEHSTPCSNVSLESTYLFSLSSLMHAFNPYSYWSVTHFSSAMRTPLVRGGDSVTNVPYVHCIMASCSNAGHAPLSLAHSSLIGLSLLAFLQLPVFMVLHSMYIFAP